MYLSEYKICTVINRYLKLKGSEMWLKHNLGKVNIMTMPVSGQLSLLAVT